MLSSVDEAVVWANELVSKVDDIGDEVEGGDDKPFYNRQ